MSHPIRKTEVLATNRGMEVVIVSKDQIGCTFLAVLVRCNERETRYLGVSVNKARLESIKTGEISLRDAFLKREGAWLDCYATSPIPNDIVSKVRRDAIPDAYLPPDVYLRPARQIERAQSLAH